MGAPDDSRQAARGDSAPPSRLARVGRWSLRRLLGALVWSATSLILVVLVLAVLAALLSGRPVALPVWAVAETESRINRMMEGRAIMSLGGVEVLFSPSRLPELRLQDLRISPPEGGGSVRLPDAVARFSGQALLRARIEPVAVRLTGTQIALRRESDGRIDFDLGGGGDAPASFGELLERVDAFFSLPALATLQRIEAEAITFTLDDRRAGRVWTVGDGRATLLQSEDETRLSIGMGLVEASAPATARLDFGIRHGGQGARIAVRVDNVAAADIAAQSPLLLWLGVLDAPISGDLRAELGGDGGVRVLEGSLAIGAGALSPEAGAPPVPIRSADLVFGFDPERSRIHVSRLSLDSTTVRLQATAHADLLGLAESGVPSAYVAQLRIDELLIDPAGVFAEPVRFSQGAIDLRLKLDPFSVDLGQLALVEDGRHLRARGGVSAGAAGWTVALDLDLDAIRHDRLVALWPVGLVPNTRRWLANNVQEGLLFDVKAGLRLRPGQEPRLSLGYEFEDADVRFMPTLPPIRSGRGYAAIEGQTYITVVEDGHVIPPEGGRIDVARSVFRVPDIRLVPAPAEVTLQTSSSITAALSLLDQPPFSFLTKAGLPIELGTGQARLVTELRLPLKANLPAQEVGFTVTGELSELRSERLVPGRVLTAERLELRADTTQIAIAGAGRLGQAGFDARWVLPLGPGNRGGGTVTGTVALDQGFAGEFLTALGPGVLSGSGRAEFGIELPKGAAPRLTLSSDLAGVGVNIRDLGWSKAARARGRLEIAGGLQAPIRFERVVLEGPGLGATGRLALTADGGLERLSLERFNFGDWLMASAEVSGQGRGRAPKVEITGGRADLRRLPAGMTAGGGGGGAGPTIPVTLERVQISETIALDALRASITPRAGGVDGSFTGRLNGQAPVRGRMVPGPRGTAIRLQSDDGGAALAAARIFTKAQGGALDLVLNPTGNAGHYDGTFEMTGFRVRDLPALAELLNAISIVGLLDQLSGPGLAFSSASGQFRLTPGGVELREGNAVGASFGVSLEGVYLTGQDLLDLQGVISPLYLLNGIGAVLTRPGEGLMGFTYRIRGSSRAPQVSVNPLSVLAPGFFRDLLRRPAARIQQ